MEPLPPTYVATKDALQRVAVHVLARRRQARTGKFGLRAAPDGIATPASGDDHEVLRTSGALLIRERTGSSATTTSLDLQTSTLADAAAFAGVDLDAPLDIGRDTPPAGSRDAVLQVDDAAARVLGRWLTFAWAVLDGVVAALGPAGAPNVVQLWPEHFDAGCDVAAGPSRVNLGASTGDRHVEQPYLYVQPWEAFTPDPYWNVDFGAVLTYDELRSSADAAGAGSAFFRHGIELLSSP